MFVPKEDNVGGRDLISTRFSSHWEALTKAKSSLQCPGKKLRMKPSTPSKKDIYQTHEHLRNLMSLNSRIGEIGRWQDRLKNPNDPFAYPTLFFRKVSPSASKPKHSKQLSKTTAVGQPRKCQKQPEPVIKKRLTRTEFQFSLSPGRLEQVLPRLLAFDKPSIKRYAQAMVSAVELFDVKTTQQLQELSRIAVMLVPAQYPPDFEDIIKTVISEISRSM